MTDHADTIRRALRHAMATCDVDDDENLMQIAEECADADAALDEFVAERQQAIDEAKKWKECFDAASQSLDATAEDLNAANVRCEQAIDALREAQHQCRENIRRAAFAPEIGTRYTEKLRLAIADECRKLEDGISAALVSLGETE